MMDEQILIKNNPIYGVEEKTQLVTFLLHKYKGWSWTVTTHM